MSGFLVVPIDVAALVVSGQPAPGHTGFAPPLLRFDQLPWRRDVNDTNAGRFLSEMAVKTAFTPAEQPPEKGVHMHWAMPDALTRGTRPVDEQGKSIPGSAPQFPSLPDRWLVVRVARRSGLDDVVTSFVIDSRFVAPEASRRSGNTDSNAIPWPTSDGQPQPFRYLGRTVPLSEWAMWLAPGDAWVEKLDATSFGSIELAAYYPSTTNVFGFYDALEELDTDKSMELSYAVIGWHLRPGDDPIAGVDPADLKKTLDTLRWQVTDPGALDRSAYCGMVHSVGYNPDLLPAEPQPLQATLGNTTSEAVSKLIAGVTKTQIDPDTLEFHLHTFLTGQFQVLGDSAGPLMIKRQLHRQRFSPVAAGSTWYVRGSNQADLTATLAAPLRALLDDLNNRQADADALLNRIRGKQWQVFADWYKYLAAAYPGLEVKPPVYSSDIKDFLRDKALPELEDDLAAFPGHQDAVQTAHTALSAAKLPEGTELATKPSELFWQPSDPTLLLQGMDVDPALRYGGDGLHADDGMLVCRRSDSLVTRLAAPDGAVNGSAAITLGHDASPDLGPELRNTKLGLPPGLADVVNGFVLETVLLWPGWSAARLAGKDDPAPWLTWLTPLQEAFLAGAPQSLYDGLPPSPVGVDAWKRNPWLPILMHWEVNYWPTQKKVNEDSTIDPHLILSRLDSQNNDSFDGDGVELVLAGDAPSTEPTSYSGITFITPHAGFAVVKRLKKYAADHPGSELGQVAADLTKPLPLLSQALDGFHDRFLLRRKTPQLRVDDPFAGDEDKEFVQRVRQAVEKYESRVMTAAPMVEDYFCPVRAGMLELSQLWLVDVFGQFRSYTFDPGGAGFSAARALAAPRMFATKTQAPAFMPPRISQAALLRFRWLAAEGGGGSGHSSASPICGWVLPNYLDVSLMIYTAGGVALGSVTVIDGTLQWLGAPTNMATFGKDIDAAFGLDADPQLKAFVHALRAQTERGYLDAFLNSINSASALVQPLHHAQSAGLPVLIGQPLALVRATLTLDLMRPPAINNTWSAFASDMKKATRTTNGHENVLFPVLLGSADDPDDGLIGFYVDGAYDKFHSLAHQSYGGVPVRCVDSVRVSVAGAPVTVTMLIDPRCPAHATTGYMPVQSLQIPTETFRAAFESIAVTFLTAPVLTPTTDKAIALPLPLPGQQQGEWSWVTVSIESNVQTPSARAAVPLKMREPFADPSFRLEEGWLLLKGGAGK